jgi:hypothetical protein
MKKNTPKTPPSDVLLLAAEWLEQYEDTEHAEIQVVADWLRETGLTVARVRRTVATANSLRILGAAQ